MRTLRCGDTGLLVELDHLDEVLSLYRELRDNPPPGVVDLVPAARTLLVHCHPGTDLPTLARLLQATGRTQGRRSSGELIEIPVVYNGPDLTEVAEMLGLDERDVVKFHTRREWSVAFCGFSPGFGYLVADEPGPNVPRRRSPRTRVPAGAVALAGEFSGVYPRTSPGGWQLIGHTDTVLWDSDREPPALLRPGVRARFVEVE